MAHGDLIQEADLFSVSVRLQTASSTLGKIVEEEDLDEAQTENLELMGSLIRAIDWNRKPYEAGEFSQVTATSVRPYFYRAFTEIGYPPTRDFLDRIYITLQSGFQDRRLTNHEIELTSQLMAKMSGYILSEFQSHMGRL